MTQTRGDARNTARLDPRNPLVLDTRELGRRPGSMLRRSLTVPAPELLGIEVIAVPEGADVELDLRLESVVDGVLVSGEVRALAVGECGRCLEPVEQELVVDLTELYSYVEDGKGRPREELDTDDEDTRRLEGDLLDLEPALRDAVVLALPMTPVCRPDCEGLCVGCGEPLADLPADHSHDETDPRWSALGALTEPGPDEG